MAGAYRDLPASECTQQAALELYQLVHRARVASLGKSAEDTLTCATNCISLLLDLERYREAKSFARAQLRLATRALGADHSYVLSISEDLASAILYDDKSTAQEKIDAEASLVHTIETMRRVHGPESAEVRHAEEVLEYARSVEEESDSEEDA